MLLLYCMLPSEGPPASTPAPGVRGAEVLAVGDDPQCLYSSLAAFETSDPAQLKEDALAFFSVVNAALQRAAVIPFRFPTLLPDKVALEGFLTEHGATYAAELDRLRGTVQMNISLPSPAAQPDRTSGTSYLQSKRTDQAATAELIQRIQRAAPARAWKHDRAPGAADSGDMLHALIDRTDIAEFRQTVRTVLERDAPQAHVSGPWPPTAFINCYPDLH